MITKYLAAVLLGFPLAVFIYMSIFDLDELKKKDAKVGFACFVFALVLAECLTLGFALLSK